MNIQKSALSSNSIISIVIPCYNQGQRLSGILTEVIKTIPDNLEIILSDDSTDDDSSSSLLAFSRKFPETAVYRKNESRLGYAGNLIQAIHLSHGEYLFVLMDEDSLVPENLAIFIEDIIKDNYHISISATHLDHPRNDTLEVSKVSAIDVLGALRHPSGLTIRRELVNEALNDQFVLNAIDKAPQYPHIPIGLFCSLKFHMYKYHLTVVQRSDEGWHDKEGQIRNSGSNWTSDATLPHFSTLTARANQIETYIEMIDSLISSEGMQSLPFIELQKRALDEQIYILLEEGVNRNFEEKTVATFYKRSAINSIRWLLSKKSPIEILRHVYHRLSR